MRDHISKDGAARLTDRLKSYWDEHGGHEVETEIINAGFKADMRASRYDVRSNMLNGWPVTHPGNQ